MALVLVAEDEAAISLMLEDALTEHGYAVAGPFAYGASALCWLTDHTPDLALLDLGLRDGLCIEVARLLHGRGVPLLFFSGMTARHSLPADLEGVPWLAKPATTSNLMRSLRSLARAPTGGP
jgi:DNA-binding response OmpR family regulator